MSGEIGDRRTGDTISINGDYQYNAFNSPNPIQRFWHQSKARMVHDLMPPNPGENVLDVGCGSGVITDYLGSLGANALGIDINPEALAFASGKFTRPNVSFMPGHVDVDFSVPQPVDKIYCLEVIEHIYYHQGESMLKAFQRVLKPGGMAFITTPNYFGIWPVIEKVFDLFDVTPKMAGEQHVAFYTARKLKELCQRTGFNIEKAYVVNFVAPWVAPVSWKLAIRLERLEQKWNIPIGANLVYILRKADGTGAPHSAG